MRFNFKLSHFILHIGYMTRKREGHAVINDNGDHHVLFKSFTGAVYTATLNCRL